MSASLRIGLAGAQLEALSVDIVVVGCFVDERPLRGTASRADWRSVGALSQLLRDGSFRGDVGEAALIVGARGLDASRLLLLGLGECATLDSDRIQDWGIEALSRCRALSAKRVAIALLPAARLSPREQSVALVAAALRVSEAAPEHPASDFEVWLAVLAEDRNATAAALHELSPRLSADVQFLESGPEPKGPRAALLRQPAAPGGAHQAPSTLYR